MKMAFKPTKEQETIINARNTSLLVSAAAGSGKTAVLVERIASIVCDEKNPVDIDRILVVTFTQAAAAEMKERVLKRINEKLEEDPENEHLQRQVTLVHQAPITTIDSFCLDVVRNHFQEVGIEPDFRVADEGETKLIKQDVLGKILEKAYSEKDPAFIRCVEAFCPGNDDMQLEDLIMSICRNADSYPWPIEYLMDRKNDHAISSVDDLGSSKLKDVIFDASYGYVQNAISSIDSAIRMCEDVELLAPYVESFEIDKEYFGRLLNAIDSNDLDLLYEVANEENTKLTIKSFKAKNDEEKEIRESIGGPARKLRDAAWAMIGNMTKRYFAFPLEEQVQMISESGKDVNVLIDLAISFFDEYAKEKKKRHTIDFSDMSHLALNILTTHEVKDGEIVYEPTDAAIEYRDRFVEVMTDEYQDSNLVQEIILSVVSAESIERYDRFMVGDVKQSIYSFRQARPDLFIDKQKEYDKEPPHMEVDLSGNFRSRSEVIDSVNRVFERIMHEKNGGVEYDETHKLIAKAKYPEADNCKTELLIYDNKMMEGSSAASTDNDDADSDESGSGSAADFMDDASDKCELEAMIIASKIRELMKSQKVFNGNMDNPELRTLSYKDIVILRRSLNKTTETYRKVFARMGIPLYAEGKNGYFKASEVSLLLQYLRVLSNPLDDIPLYAVMHSVFGGFDENEIALIRAGHKEMPLYENLLLVSGRKGEDPCELKEDLREKINSFLDSIDRYRNMSGYLTVRELLEKVTLDHHYMEMVSALPAGQSRIGNVQMLLVMASGYEKSSYLGLNDFIRYIDNMEKFEVDAGEVGSASEEADVVRLMTIHKSKGLEFPVVFLAGMGKEFNFMDLNKTLLIDNKLGIGCKYVDTAARVSVNTLRYNAVADKKKCDIVAEEMRLLYVAMTRAREKLIMIGGMADVEKKLPEYLEYPSESLSAGSFQTAKSYFDLVLPVIGCKEVRDVIDIELPAADDIYLAEKNALEEEAAGFSEFTSAEVGDLSLADKEYLDLLEKKFSYVYPYGYFENLYTKTTVSELKMAAMAERDEGAYNLMEHGEDETAVPVFAGGNTSSIYDDADEKETPAPAESPDKAAGVSPKFIITGTERGNAYHRCMQLLSWDRILGPVIGTVPASYAEYTKALSGKESEVKKSIESFWSEELTAGHISEKTHAAVAPYKILTFLRSELSYRMWRAEISGLLKREQPFVYGIPASRLLDPEHRNTGSEVLDKEILMIQGIIDAYFVEDGKIILLDYKTDAVTAMDELWKRYETQMDYYKEALESLEHLQVTERFLYSFKLGTC